MKLERFSFGMGDRFAHQGEAQLSAILAAQQKGIEVVPVWNKSHREHTIVGSHPAELRAEADQAVKALGWQGAYYVDADHINAQTVGLFMEVSDFFTIDVADAIGQAAPDQALEAFVARHQAWVGDLEIDGLAQPITVRPDDLHRIARQYLGAARQAGNIYRLIESAKGPGNFVAEVSMDETDAPQSPGELFFILAALAGEGVQLQTIAPKFTGRFNKGVDYQGPLEQFATEFDQDLCVLAAAVRAFNLPDNLKLSVHSGSDKFSLYPLIREAVSRRGAGLHLKTAGTTWLEEVIGLAEAGGSGLMLAKQIYAEANQRRQELCAPYATVIDINPEALPDPTTVNQWDSATFCAALRHDPSEPTYNPHLRQLLHVGFKVAAGMGERYREALREHAPVVARNVQANLLERHLLPLFPASANT